MHRQRTFTDFCLTPINSQLRHIRKREVKYPKLLSPLLEFNFYSRSGKPHAANYRNNNYHTPRATLRNAIRYYVTKQYAPPARREY